jgi:hypothetical protein
MVFLTSACESINLSVLFLPGACEPQLSQNKKFNEGKVYREREKHDLAKHFKNTKISSDILHYMLLKILKKKNQYNFRLHSMTTI